MISIDRLKNIILLALTSLSFLLPATAIAADIVPQESDDNLLRNPGFEEGWTRETFNGATYGEIFTPRHWVTWWSEGSTPDGSGHYGRPEVKVIPNVSPFNRNPVRIRSGDYALQQFCMFRTIDAGVYQTITDLTPGSYVDFSAYGHTWSCPDERNGAYSCLDPENILLQVGIDPNGGTNAWSPRVTWTGAYSNDVYRLIGPVRAQVGRTGTVTVFLRATARWPFKHNDVYWDDARLVYVGEPEASPTPSPTHTSPQSSNPFAEVQATLRATRNPTSTPLPSPTTTPAPSPTPEPGSICVLAFHDRNQDGVRQPASEPLLAGVTVTVQRSTGGVRTHVTTAQDESYCFTDLPATSYIITAGAPDDFTPTTQSSYPANLSPRTTINVAFGFHPAAPTPSPTAVASGSVDSSPPGLYPIFLIAGGAVLACLVVLGIDRARSRP
jgi:hypothetical protein